MLQQNDFLAQILRIVNKIEKFHLFSMKDIFHFLDVNEMVVVWEHHYLRIVIEKHSV